MTKPLTNHYTGIIVALRKESVDRNLRWLNCFRQLLPVALRKESVDRNPIVPAELTTLVVALRKESVDRNLDAMQIVIVVMSRSPQGERG